MSKQESDAAQKSVVEDDEPDDWDKRIFSTGCADENAKLTDCYFEKKDWRQCTAELKLRGLMAGDRAAENVARTVSSLAAAQAPARPAAAFSRAD
ncbi:hypothetical protein EsH8_X_000414 [Colletotrichum jinshuiense]